MSNSEFNAYCKLVSIDIKNSFFIKNITPVIIFLMGYISMSPLLPYVGWRGVYSLGVIFIFSILFIKIERLKYKIWFLCVSLTIITTSSITSIYWGDPRYVFSSIFLIAALFIVQFSCKIVLEKVISIATVFMIFMLLSAVLAFYLTLIGIQPIASFPNPDGRLNHLFFTTLSNAWTGNFIRPAGIYDEPGAFSFYACAIAALRHLMNKDKKITWLILSLGFITFSLAHLIYVFFHLIAERFSLKNLARMLVVMALIAFGLFFSGVYPYFENILFSRLVISDSTGTIQGDNRSFRMVNSIEHLSSYPHSLLYGADPSCRFEYEICKQKFPPMGENPLSPLVFQGIFVSWPYYVAVIFLLLSPIFGKKFFVSFGMGLLLLQRPNLLSIDGSMNGVLVIYLTFINIYWDRGKPLLKPLKGYFSNPHALRSD